MPNADGSVVIATDLDNKTLEKKLNKLTKEIEKLEGSISDGEAKKSPLIQQAEALQARIKAARAEAAQYQKDWMSGVAGADQKQSQAITRAQQLEAEHAGVVAQIDKIDAKLLPAYEKLEGAKQEAGGLAQQLSESSRHSGALDAATKKAQKSMQRLSLRMREVLRSALIFTLISQSIAAFRNWMGKVITANDEASAAVARLKGALLTMAQPLLNVVIPAFVTLVNLLTQLVGIVAQVLASLFGTTLDGAAKSAEALNAETEALEDVGGAAKKAGRSLASFDEINKLSSGSTGGGGASSGIAPDFSGITAMADEQLKNILALVKAIGAGLLAWRIGKALGLGMKEILALFVAIMGAITMAENLFDAWVNGVSWNNLAGALAGLALLAGGLYIAFGSVAAGISLIVGGIALLVTAFHDAYQNGWNLQNLFMSIAGILAAGLGIAVLTGSWIPLLIAAVASLLLAVTVAMGQGEELLQGLQMVLQGFLDFFVGIFTGDITRAIGGIQTMCDGLKLVITAILEGLRLAIISFLDWLDEQTNGRLHGLIEAAKGFFNAFFQFVESGVSSVVDGIKQILGGLIEFISGVFTGDWSRAWSGIASILKGIWNAMVGVVESAINLLIRGLNALIQTFNQTFAVMRALVGFPPYINPLEYVELPRLAQGAVIPPNREFLAVLGDQKSGTNIEAPLSTIEEAVENVLNRRGTGGGEQTIILECDKVQFAKLVYKLNQSESKRHGVSLVGV